MQIFYTPNIEGSEYIFSKEESKHIIRVLRKSVGDSIHHTDGKGNLFRSSIIKDNDKGCIVKTDEVIQEYGRRDFCLSIAIAPTKNIGRLEWFLEKATEIGIDYIHPFFSFHSERKTIKTERLEKLIVAAMKQSVKAYKPVLEDVSTFNILINKPFDGKKFIAFVDDNITQTLNELYQPGENACILIGPEGDFSKDEFSAAKDQGFVPINLGKSRLRTETAGLVACSWINILNNK